MTILILGAHCLSKEMAEDVAEDLRKMGFRVRSPLEVANCVRARHSRPLAFCWRKRLTHHCHRVLYVWTTMVKGLPQAAIAYMRQSIPFSNKIRHGHGIREYLANHPLAHPNHFLAILILRSMVHLSTVSGSLLLCWLQVAGAQVTYWRSDYSLVMYWLPVCGSCFFWLSGGWWCVCVSCSV